MAKKALCELFESNQVQLQQALTGMTLPKDMGKVQNTVSSYLEKVFDTEGEFRQNLTQSEDYILEAAISLLNAQQKISSALLKDIHYNSDSKKQNPSVVAPEKKESSSDNVFNKGTNSTLIGVAGGAIAGKLILGGWGAVFGAIAGVALSIYLSNRTQTKTQSQTTRRVVQEETSNKPIDVDSFIHIIHDVCESVDNLISTFRAQVNRVVQKYESIQKPTLEDDYLELLENIQALLGAYVMNPSSDIRAKRIEQRIQLLAECLENYSLQSVNYDGNNKEMFNFQPSANVMTETMVLPAVIKDGKVILKGKIFTIQ